MPPLTIRPAATCLLMAALVVSGMTSFGSSVRGASADERPGDIDAIREESRRLRSDLAREQWAALTKARPEKRANLFRAHAALLLPSTLEQIRTARAAAADSGEIRVLELLEVDLARFMMLAGVASLDDEIARQMAGLEADVEDYPRPLTLKELDRWIARDPDSLRVRMLESVRLALWRDRLDPLFEHRRTTIDSLAIALGYGGYTEFSTRLRRSDPGQIMACLMTLVRATDTMYQVLTRELTQPIGPAPARGGSRRYRLSTRDLVRLEWTEEFDRYVDSSPALARSFDSTVHSNADSGRRPLPAVHVVPPEETREGHPPIVLSLDDVRADVVAIDPPADIRILVTGLTGVAAARAALAAAGAARQRNGTAESSPEGREAGSDLLAAAAGHLYAGLVSTPEWYETHRRLDRETGRDSDITRLSDPNLARLIRWRLWCDLKWVRTELASGLLTELMQHRAGTDLWMPYIFVPVGADPREMIRQIRGFARGLELTSAEAYDAYRPGDDFLGCLDEARGVALAAAVEERLRADLGSEWFLSPNVADLPIFQTGDGWALRDEREQVRLLTGTAGELDFGALRRRYERLFDWSEQVLERAR